MPSTQNLPDVIPDHQKIKRDQYAAPRRFGCMSSCGLSLVILSLTVFFVVVVTVYMTTSFFNNVWDGVQDLFGFGGGSEAEVVETRLILLGIQKMSMLQTTSGDILVEEKVVKKKTSILKDARLYIRYIGRITAGIDLATLTEDDIYVGADNRIRITLPPAQITGCYLQDPQILDNSCGTSMFGVSDCSKIYQEMQEEAYTRGLQDLFNAADELQMLDQAYSNAEDSIGNLLQDLGYSGMTFDKRDDTLPPDKSCIVE